MPAEAADYLDVRPELVEHSVTDRFDRTDVQRACVTAAKPAPGRLKVVAMVSVP
ncbi:MAG: hypothetical protein M0013_01615 [Actinomycetota bacterium]|nr:hypothetical protein [Actinomycetota bacterium]